MAFNLVHKGLYKPHCKLVRAVVVVSVFGIVANYFKVGHNPVGVSHGVNACVLNCRKRIRRARQPRNARCKESANFGVVQSHFQSFVTVFVVHVMNKVQNIHIKSRKPVHHLRIFALYLFEIEFAVSFNAFEYGRNLHGLAVFVFYELVPTAVYCV